VRSAARFVVAELDLRLAIRLILEDHFEVEDEIDQAYLALVELLGEPWAQKQVAELPNVPQPSPGVRPMELSDVQDAPPLGDLWRTMILLRDKKPDRMRWVVSSATVDEIDRQQDAKPGYRAHAAPPGTPLTYFGMPVRIDESAEGVTYEVLDG
jgi:hypothetical protein